MITVNQPLSAGDKLGEITPARIVVHCMAQFIRMDDINDIPAVDYLRSVRLSAHAFVDPSGVVIRSRKDNQGAYHASGVNTTSLGVEILVQGAYDYPGFLKRIRTKYVTPPQYYALIELVTGWIQKHNIKQIDRHSDIAIGKKFDPGDGFNWEQFKTDVDFR